MTAPGYRLKPCPFCGSEPVMREIEAHSHGATLALGIPDHPGSFVVECSCDAGFVRDTESAAAEAWNRRAAAPQPEPPLIVGKSLLREPEQLPASECARHLDNLAKALDADRKAEAKPEPTADLVESAKVFRREWMSDDAHLYSGEGTPNMMAAFAQEHAAAEKARADKAEKALDRPSRDTVELVASILRGAGVENGSYDIAHDILQRVAAAIRARKGGGDE